MDKNKSLTDVKMHYCTGCGHSVIHRIVCDVIDELGVREKVVAVAPVGCAVIAYEYWNFDVTEAAHGRCPAVATGIKRVLPENIVFTYQGDGDLAAIGTSEIIHAANRGEKITVIFVNNGVYGMTGGQMAPTTMVGQRTATSHKGRDITRDGFPLKISEMISILDGVKYVERTAVHNKEGISRTKEAIKKAFNVQLNNEGFSMVEVVSLCPVYGAKSIKEAYQRIDDTVTKVYPLGVLKG
ncbi:MAG: 2-oxoglutarate oxidoreductase [Candidatus Omnitrophica bacterium]|nr:2-oxoglutarate oxidoreductase [Candidatus Omnitrophota bacterium]